MGNRKYFGWSAFFALVVMVCAVFVTVNHLQATGVSQGNQLPARIPANFNTLAGPQAVTPMPIEMVDADPSAVRMRYLEPPLDFGTVQLGNTDYETVRMSGEANTIDPGYPDLPRVCRMIMIDPRGNVEVRVTDMSYRVEQGGMIAPVQILEGDDDYVAGQPVVPNEAVYGANAWYPAEIATISEPATFRDVRFVVLTIFPVQYNPVTGERRIFDNIETIVENIGGVGANERTINPTSVTATSKAMYSMFENFPGSTIDALPVVPGKYRIYCDDDATVVGIMNQLATWKKKKGLDVTVVTAASWSIASLKTDIDNAYNASNGTLEFALLVGDPDASNAPYDMATHASQYDNYFGTISSGGGPNPDPVPDVAIGRFSPINSSAELQSLVTKTINYESAPTRSPDNGWFQRAWAASGTQFIASNPSTKEYTRQIMLQHGVGTVFWNVYGGHVSPTDIVSRFTTGISVFNHRMSWIGETNTGDVNGLPINGRYPFVAAITCASGTFTDGTSVSEAYLRPSDMTGPGSIRGAIGCVGLWGTGTHVPYNNIVDAGLMYGLYVLNVQEQGQLVTSAKLELYRNYAAFGHLGDVENFSYWSNLMGDPSTPIWTKLPKRALVARPSTVNIGTNNIDVTVTDSITGNPIPNALVGVLKGTFSAPETWARGYTNAAGQINLPLTLTTAGYVYLTVTKDDRIPHLDSVQVVSPTLSLAYNSNSIDDDNVGGTVGDNNDSLNTGETIDLSFGIRNPGSSTVTGINGTLTTTSPGINITTANSAYPNINAGGNANNTTPFRFSVTSVFNNEPVQLYLNLTTGNAGTFTIRLDLTPRAGDVQYVSNVFGGPGGNFNPGEVGTVQVTYRNSGNRTLISSLGILRSLDANVSVTDSLGTYGTVTPNTNSTNSVDMYNVNLSAQSFNGHVARLMLVITDANGFRDSTEFNITIGTQATTSPTGPDGSGYRAFDNTESQPGGSASTYSWIELNPGPGTSLGFSDVAEDDDDFTVLNLPFTYTFYGNNFTQITVCSNGWLAFGNYAMWDFRNYRMGSPIGPPYMVAAYWDDLEVSGANNVYWSYDAANHWYIVEWKAQTQYTNVAEIFEVIIYDPAFYPSASGNGKLKVQYNTVNLNQNPNSNDNDYASVGIQNGDHSHAIDYYYWQVHSPGSATLQAGRSIMYTTDANGQLNPIITVNTPNGGETFYVGQAYNLLWNSAAVSGNVSIEINRTYPSATWITLFASTSNDGVESWLTTGPAGTTNRLRVRSITNPAIGDTSNANFEIVQPTCQITSPNGGEVWIPAQIYYITYNSVGLGAATVAVNRNYPLGAWEVLDPAAAGTVVWNVSGAASNACRIRAISNSIPSLGDTSDANFTVGSYPVVAQCQLADGAPGAFVLTAEITDDLAGFTGKLFYRVVGAANFDSLALVATGNPDEFAVTTPALAQGRYEYYVRTTDTQALSTYVPASGTYFWDVYPLGSTEISYDDGGAENYNWVSGPGYVWAVKFDAPAYPYILCNARFAIAATSPFDVHQGTVVTVYNADGPGALPGTILYRDTTGSPGNTVGGLLAGTAWASAVTRTAGNCLVLNGPFYIAVANGEPRTKPNAFATDTSAAPRNNRSYFYDNCDAQWYLESAVHENARPGDRMIRAAGFALNPPTITVIRSATNAKLDWPTTGAPYYKVYASNTFTGVYAPIGTTSTNTFNEAIGVSNTRFYKVQSSDQP
jgi:hypothetical protein